MDTKSNKYTLYASESARTLINGVWINPHTSKANTPVRDGGLVLSNFPGKTKLPEFDITYPSTGRTDKVRGGPAVDILPILLTPPYSIVITESQSIYVRKPIYVKQDGWPTGVRIVSVVSLFFVLADDTANNLCVVNFKSHLSNEITQSFRALRNDVAILGRRLVEVPLEVFAIPSTLKAGPAKAVGQKQVGYIAPPIFEIPKIETADDLDKIITPPKRFEELKEIAQDSSVRSYPFDSLSQRICVSNYEEALAILSGSNIGPTGIVPADPRRTLPGTGRVISVADLDEMPF